MTTPSLTSVAPEDFNAMADIRVEALRESLERLGRFDPMGARERLGAGFVPQHMNHIVVDAERAGFITLRPPVDSAINRAMALEHLYLRLAFQGKGIGAWALNWAKTQAQLQGFDITLSALKQSDANRFYLRHGFMQVDEREFDLDYRWTCGTGVTA